MAHRATKSKRLDPIIPIYVNLKELNLNVGRNPNSDLIRSFVLKVLNRSNNRDIDEFLEQNFDDGLKTGTWLFFFDSFDEIPDVLSSVEADLAIRTYAQAIADFLGGLNSCRGIIASRQFRGPGQLGWPRFRILGLSRSRRFLLIRRAALETKPEADLLSGIEIASEEIRAMATNPMFLGLLVEHIRNGREFPDNAHMVFEDYLQNRLDRDADKIARRFQLTVVQIRETAESAAFCMAADPGLGGLSPQWNALVESIAKAGLTYHDRALAALEYIKLARSESASTDLESRSFTFAHRRFQEYFATCVVLKHPLRVTPEKLLTDGRWRETAVVLCQTQRIENISALLQHAEQLVSNMAAEISSPRPRAAQMFAHVWPEKSLHLLRLLQEGSKRRDILSEQLRSRETLNKPVSSR